MQRTLLARVYAQTLNGLLAMRAVRFLGPACSIVPEAPSARAKVQLVTAEAHLTRALSGNVLWVVTGATFYSARPARPSRVVTRLRFPPLDSVPGGA